MTTTQWREAMTSIRIGFGYDVHPLEQGARFVLGGVDIPFSKGATGHSDADVLIHAIIDAILGACGLPDIGRQFPDTDLAYRKADSRLLLLEVMQMMRLQGYELSNMDATICLEEPKIAPYIEQMSVALSQVMKVAASRLSIKAKTNERLGFIGIGQAVSAYAVVLICSSS